MFDMHVDELDVLSGLGGAEGTQSGMSNDAEAPVVESFFVNAMAESIGQVPKSLS